VQAGITLVLVPYWWNFSTEQLAATIHKNHPILITKPPNADPIPETCPHTVFEAEKLPPLCQGQTWDGLQDLTGW
jgi:hypothetical protein